MSARRRQRLEKGALTALILALASLPVLAATPEPDAYHGPPYSAPVPATLSGASVVDADKARALHAAGVGFIDVYPQTRRPEGLPAETLWRVPVYETIPGAIWAPGTGYDKLSSEEEARLEAALTMATGDDPAQPVVVFCRRDCWMSWNAARRAVALGYTAVNWFPDGIEGWQETGGVLTPASPIAP